MSSLPTHVVLAIMSKTRRAFHFGLRAADGWIQEEDGAKFDKEWQSFATGVATVFGLATLALRFTVSFFGLSAGKHCVLFKSPCSSVATRSLPQLHS